MRMPLHVFVTSHSFLTWAPYNATTRPILVQHIFDTVPIDVVLKSCKSVSYTGGPILIVLTTRSYALTSDATGVANAIWLF